MKLVEITKDIESVIRAVDSIDYRTLLETKYLGFIDWDEIASRMDYSRLNVFYVHSRAIRTVHIPAA